METVDDSVSLPLEGIRVIDFTQVMVGPCCTQMLADYGADVIKIEKVDGGDLSRWSLVDEDAGAAHPVFCSLNRNKRSVMLDLKTPQGVDDARGLIEGADVVVNNFRPGVMDRMGLGYEPLSAGNPGLIYASATGFGSQGPYSRKGGQDALAQALCGAMERRAPGAPLSIYPIALADYAAGMHLFQGILLALMQRAQTGRGQKVEAALFNSMIAMQMQEAAMWLMRREHLNWVAMPLGGVFETADGALVMIGAFTRDPLRRICAALGIDDLSRQAQFADLAAQVTARDELQRIFRDRFAGHPTGYWLERLEAQNVLCAPVRSLAEALADPQTEINRLVLESNTARGCALRVVGSPIFMSAAEVNIRRPPPELGEHTEEVLAELRAARKDRA